jgi:hypothetical protein
MAAIAREEAVGMLKHAIGQFQADDLRETYNELFPETPVSEGQVRKDAGGTKSRILDHINHGLEIEEILDLWPVVFPNDRNVFYDEDTATIHINEEPQRIQYAD